MAELKLRLGQQVRPPSEVECIYRDWFGDIVDGMPLHDPSHLWQGHDEKSKAYFREHYTLLIQRAANHELSHWPSSPEGTLALILLLHRLPHIAFENDEARLNYQTAAVQTCMQGLLKQQDKSLSFCERLFFYHPLFYSEQPRHQALSMLLYSELLPVVPVKHRRYFETILTRVKQRRDLITRFNRDPFRNHLFARQSTEDELHYLQTNDVSEYDNLIPPEYPLCDT